MTAAELLYACETEILEAIAEQLRKGNLKSSNWRMEQLGRLGIVNQRAAAIIKKYRADIAEASEAEVQEIARATAVEIDRAANAARRQGAPVPVVDAPDVDPIVIDVIGKYTAQAGGDLSKALAQMAQRAGQAYADTIAKAAVAAGAGIESGRSALVSAIREWSAQGLTSLVDSAGRHWTTEAYGNMVIRTAIRRTTTDVMFARGEEYGTDLVEVSAHAGARPGCAPYQGRIYSRSGTSEKYPALDSTSYGEPAGLFGINCGHIAYPYWEGVSEQRFQPTENEAANDIKYAESQKQRAIERSIRASKRELAAMEKLGVDKGIEDARALVKGRQATMREFIEDTGRTRLREREQIYD